MNNQEFAGELLNMLDYNIASYLRVERDFNSELLNLIDEKLKINEEEF